MEKRRIPVYFPDGSLNSIGDQQIFADTLGSYTGLVKTPDDKPVQDADDL